MSTHPPRLVIACLALLLILGASGPAAAKYEIELANRSFTPAPELISRAEDAHVVIQFLEIPTSTRREELRAAGITLLDYVPNYAWVASVKGGALSALDAAEVRAVFGLTPDDKIARTAIGQPVVRAFVYEDVADPLAFVSAYGEVIGQDRTAFTLRLTGDLRALASEDAVKYVAGPLPEKVENNDDIRDNINADEVQAAPYGLSGLGVTVGMWDNGAASTSHADYASRLTVGDGSSTGTHPTLVCGVMAGDGTRSTVYGGSPYQWRGVATEADIASYSWPDDLANMDAEHSHAISNYDIILSQNSWSWGLCSDYCEYYGEYDDWSQNYDKLVRGSQGKRLTVVFSAGNDGDCYGCSGAIPDFPYGTIPGPGSTAKNAIVIGSNDADTDNLSDYSSMGPTLDGRLKPDVAAPGCKSSAGITTTYTSNNYNSSYCGTSFSAPAVSGCVAVLQEDFIDKFGGEAWPSTVKALLIQGAEDRGNPGPDFQFGYGRVNIQNTIDIVRADDGTGDLIKEDTLSRAEIWEYTVDVTGGALKVTLAWDDYEADYGVPGKTLINDLDLELEAPGGATYYPWILDPDNPSWPATTGVDDLNNVEQVEIPSPALGVWTIRVTASVMPEPNQDFSVVTSFGGSGEDPPPAPPTGLGAVPGTGEGEIDLTWNPNGEPDFDHYCLERDDDPGFTSPASFVTVDTSYSDSGLTLGQLYYYRVFAVDAGANESGPSGTASSLPRDLPPSPPTGLNAWTGVGEGEIEVAWNLNPEPDVVQYRLERADNPGFAGSISFVTPAPIYSDSGLVPGEPYYYRVFAIDAGANESGSSETVSATAQDLPPAAPTGLAAIPGPGEGEIDLTWNPNGEPDFDHYRLERCLAPDFGPGTDPFDLPEPAYHDSGLDPGETYYYRVIAVDVNMNESGPSEVVSAVALDLPPASPTGLTAAPGPGEGEIFLSWNPNPEPDLDHYLWERATNPEFEPGSEPFEEPAVSHQDSGLEPGETYYYRVSAVDAGGNVSAPSEVVSAVALDLAPAPPTGLAAVPGPGEGEIFLSWNPNPEPDLDHYLWERATNPEFEPGSEPFEEPAVSHQDSGLVPGETYYYRVSAVDAGGNVSGPSEVVSAVALDLVPSVPTGLAAAPGPGEGEIFLSWNPNPEPDLDHYLWERATNPEFEPGSEPFEEPAVSHQDSGLEPGETYYYRVSAVDATGNTSPPSGVVSAVALDLAPAPPTGLAAIPGPGEGEIFLSWNPNPEPDLDHYLWERATNPEFEPGSGPFEEPAVSHQDSGLEPGETYYYRVIAVDVNLNESGPSEAVSAVALDLVPSVPTGLTAAPGPGEGEIFLSWNPNPEPDLDHYLWERATNPEFEPGSEPFEEPAVSHQDSGLVPGETYYYRVSAVDATGNTSPPSGVVSAVALDLAPAAPTGLAAEASGGFDVLVTWDANTEPDLDRYRLERDTTDVFGAGTVAFETTEESYLDSGLDVGAVYYYRLFAIDVPGNESAPSDTVTHVFEGTGVPESYVASVSYVRPNPFAAEAWIAYTVPSDGAAVVLRVYDITGRLVRTLCDGDRAGGAYELIWDGRDATGAGVASGIYLLRAAIGEWEEVRKVVLLR